MAARGGPGWIGGNVSAGEKSRLVLEKLRPLAPVDLGSVFQCRCGQSRWVKYRAHFYCWTCGRRYPSPALDVRQRGPGVPSFREAFEAAQSPGKTGAAR